MSRLDLFEQAALARQRAVEIADDPAAVWLEQIAEEIEIEIARQSARVPLPGIERVDGMGPL